MPTGNHHHRDDQSGMIRDILSGKITITTAGVEVKVGATPFANRHTVVVNNDASKLIFLRINALPDLPTGLFIIAFSGQQIAFRINPDVPFTLFAKTDESTVDITVLEVS